MQRGDWIEVRDAPNTRGILKYILRDRTCGTPGKATVLLSGTSDLSSVSLTELDDLWEPMQFTGPPPAFWIQPKAVFVKTDPRLHDEDLYAEVVEVKPGWVAYYVKYAVRSKAPCFFMTPWWEFRKNYEPVNPPTAWDRLLCDEE
jgi:hypothetical protein